VQSNPLWSGGLDLLGQEAKAEMDAGNIPSGDSGGTTWTEFPCEMYSELFAFLSLVDPDPGARADYAARARTLLMHAITEAAKGAAEGLPFRDPSFATSDRSRWTGEGFGLTVDWIYPSLSAADKAAIRQVFLRWVQEIKTTGYHHPEPVGLVNDPALLTTEQVRWAGNNYFAAGMRNIGLMAMALDEADDPGGTLRAGLEIATGAYLYLYHHLLSTDARGGFAPEGFEYGPQTLAYGAQLLWALETAGQDDPAVWGPQACWADQPFWNDLVPAYLNSLSPATATVPGAEWMGPVYLPAWYGDGQRYWAPDLAATSGPLALHHLRAGAAASAEALRWIQLHVPAGGAEGLLERVEDAQSFSEAIFYFLLFDPAGAAPQDPRPGTATEWYAPGTGRVLARTGWDAGAAWFTYFLGWESIDHQLAEGNQFEFYRGGEWLTKSRVGWDGISSLCTIGRSDYHNTLALENDPIDREPDFFLWLCQQNGSQWMFGPSGDGVIGALSLQSRYVHAHGDATDLYNSDYEEVTDITHASRSILWLKPDHIVVYDRAESATAGRFKRFWLNLPAPAVIAGNQALMTTASGQRLSITALLPAGAALSSSASEDLPDTADGEIMHFRFLNEAPGGPASVRFLHVLQGMDAGDGADAALRVSSTAGTPYEGARVGASVVLFPVTAGAPFASTTYRVPSSVRSHFVTGLEPGAPYGVTAAESGGEWTVTVGAGATHRADEGGVLAFSPGGGSHDRPLEKP
jgi:hypothetical protein